MNVFNRIVLVILLLTLAAGAIAVVVLAWAAPEDSIDGLRDAVQWLEDNNQDFEKSLLTIGGVALALLCLLLIFLELKPRYGPDVRVTDLEGGNAVLSSASVAQRVEEAVREVEHVSDAKAIVRARRKGVEVFLDLHVDPDANLAEVTNAACAAAQEMLTERVHVALTRPPRARLHYTELRLAPARPAAEPATDGSPAAEPAPVAPDDGQGATASVGQSEDAPHSPNANGESEKESE